MADVKEAEAKPSGSLVPKGGYTRRLVAVTSNIVRKLTIRNALYIHRQKFVRLTILGIVEDFQEKPDLLEFNLRDDNGTILVKKFKITYDESEQQASVAIAPSAVPILANGNLVRVFGSPLTTPKDSIGLYINAIKIVPTEDLNEISMHKLEVLAGITTLRKVMNNSLSRNPLHDGFPDATAAKPIGVQVQYVAAKYQKKKPDHYDMVLKLIKDNKEKHGIEITELEKSLPMIGPSEIKAILASLQEEGQIFTSLDDHHFLSTDG